MFLITTSYQRSRSKRRPDKPGKVVFRIACKSDNGKGEIFRSISSNIYGDRDSVFETNRAAIILCLRVIYLIIENRLKTTIFPSIDDIADDFRHAIKGDPSMKSVLKRAQEDFPFRADRVSIGNEFKRDFHFIYPKVPVLPDKLLEYITVLSQQVKNDGKQSMARSYNSSRSSLSKFLDDHDVYIKEIDKHFVTRYSAWLKENGVIDSTQSFYLRTLRSILNRAKGDGIYRIDEDLFIGMNTRIVFSCSKKSKAILSWEIINKISKLDISDNPEKEMTRDMFMFAFYCRGMEFTDILNLTYLNIQDNIMTYNRRGVGRPRSIILDKLAIKIIKKYKNTSIYLFPLKEVYKGYQQYSISDIVRRHIKEIGNAVGFPELTFGMNISAYKQLMSQLNISDIFRYRQITPDIMQLCN